MNTENTEAPQLVVSRVFDAPRALVYRAFADPEHLAGPSEQGWLQALAKLDAALMNLQAGAADHREAEAWRS